MAKSTFRSSRIKSVSLVIALLATGCASTSRFKAVVVDNPEAARKLASPIGDTPVSGSSCSHYFLFIPLSGAASVREAYDDAISQSPGANALMGATLEDHSALITGIYNKSCYRISGKVAKLK